MYTYSNRHFIWMEQVFKTQMLFHEMQMQTRCMLVYPIDLEEAVHSERN